MYTALQNNLTSQAFGPSLKMHAQPDKCFSFVNSQGPFELISGELNFIPYSTRCVCVCVHFCTVLNPVSTQRRGSGLSSVWKRRTQTCISAIERKRSKKGRPALKRVLLHYDPPGLFASSAPTISIIPRTLSGTPLFIFMLSARARVLILPHRQGLISAPDLTLILQELGGGWNSKSSLGN